MRESIVRAWEETIRGWERGERLIELLSVARMALAYGIFTISEEGARRAAFMAEWSDALPADLCPSLGYVDSLARSSTTVLILSLPTETTWRAGKYACGRQPPCYLEPLFGAVAEGQVSHSRCRPLRSASKEHACGLAHDYASGRPRLFPPPMYVPPLV